MRTLEVSLGDRSYPIYIGSGLLTESSLLKQHINANQVAIVTNTTVAPLYLDKAHQILSGFDVQDIVLPDGESYKHLNTVNEIFDHLLEQHYNRTVTLVALGGGVVGDITGFAAACYQRGVRFIQVPTTLLSQVDSSVGGKTGVNHHLGKNMIGAFHQPACVLIDTDTLQTLPERELSAGLAEVIKYGLIFDSDFFTWLEENIESLLERDPDKLAYAIERSCQNKARIVVADEFESGIRAQLNLGHTFGHAIENHMGYGVWLHGEAVAAGIVMAADLSLRIGMLSEQDVQRIKSILLRAKLPVKAPQSMSSEDFLRAMSVDKKVVDGRIRLVLLERIGKAFVTADFSQQSLQQTLVAC